SLGYVYMTGSTGAGLDGNPHVGQNDIFLVKYNSSGARQWTLQTGSIADDVGYAVAVDGLDNLYITGSTALGFDGSFVAGWKDVFLVKYNSSGNWQWTRLLGTIEDDIGYGVAVDGLGNVYVTGFTGLGLDGNTTNGLNDIFLAKYNSSGVKQWTQQLGTSLQDVGYAVAPDSLGNIYITGSTGGGLDGNTNVGGLDIFVVKYDSSGNLQ
ncbi:MAG: SBBP repeat-containing protein, partial [Deltaproteobacteria bacterium]|nr:SBBP repeat-containing protein [Deltaproteobacteria bacterium]